MSGLCVRAHVHVPVPEIAALNILTAHKNKNMKKNYCCCYYHYQYYITIITYSSD